MRLLHARNKNLQTSTFTAAAEFTKEDNANMHLEDGTTLLELDGTASWTVQILRVPPLKKSFVYNVPETFSTTIYLTGNIVTDQDENLVDETDDEIIYKEDAGQWPTPLIHV